MKSHKIGFLIILVAIVLFIVNSCSNKETDSKKKAGFIDLTKARQQVEALAQQFSVEFRSKDSIALANHYLPNGMIGSAKGYENILSTWSKMIQNASEKGTPYLIFITNSVTTDEEYIIELGQTQWADENGNVKREGGKYVVVYKQEGGELKIYRDWGL